MALRSISESTLKTTQIHESGASPQILHVSGASTLGPLFQWSLNFTLAFSVQRERSIYFSSQVGLILVEGQVCVLTYFSLYEHSLM